MHSRNRYQDHYDFPRLIKDWPALSGFLTRTPDGHTSIDFSDPASVRMLNQALLKSDYGIGGWELPAGYLCPPIPGRADYVHGVADLLGEDQAGVIPRGAAVRVLDIGVGASCIYPLLGQAEYGWRFVGTEIDPIALRSAQAIVDANAGLRSQIELRLQGDRGRLLVGAVHSGERFDLTMCNPPFHGSAAAASHVAAEKWRKLGRDAGMQKRPALNFGGKEQELWCHGGELSFVRQLISDSAQRPNLSKWFTSLVAKGVHLAPLQQHLKKFGASRMRTVAMSQGQKQSRFLAWSFE